MYQSILVPIDGSDQSCEALRVAANLVDPESGSLYALNIQDPPLADDAMGRAAGLLATNADEIVQKEGRAVIEQACERVGLTNKQVQPIVFSGKPAQVILDESRRLGVDAVVMGSRGNSNIKSLVVGSVSYRVMHVASCAVIIVG
ncbi:universal stress protein [Halomonas halocynthiae]|uniref:universal stress protein n=1 Tax=Halomonas halocynthiae TaxID=176290 RepID=UPI0004038DAB|nr:universal stress protein [Halomonas halocynthiae]